MPANTRISRMLRHFRRRAGIPNKSSPAITTPPLAAKNLFSGLCEALVVVAVVATVNVAVAAPLPVTFAAGAEQLGESFAPAGAVVTAQVKFTVPLNPPEGVTVIDVVFPLVAPAASDRLDGLAVKAKPAATAVLTVTSTVAVAVSPPTAEVPVMFAM
jgi:hypothetical protein